MLKNRPPYPFETIAAAVAFSPRMEAVLCETKRLADLFRSKLLLIHIGKKNSQKEELLNTLIAKLKIDPVRLSVIWQEGDAVESVLKVCKENVVDLLVAGALEKESIVKFFIGSVSREICRKAKCSVLMLTDPSIEPKQLKKIVVNGTDNPKTTHTIATALYIAAHENSHEITVLKEIHTPALSMSMADSSSHPEMEKIKRELEEEENRKIKQIVDALEKGNVNVNCICKAGKPGYVVSSFAKEEKADLLVINSPDTQLTVLDRIFTHDMEYVLSDLPCNLLIVHSRVNNK